MADRAIDGSERLDTSELTGTQGQPATATAGFTSPALVAGRYRLLEQLGEGGMGRVFRAHDLQLERRLAVKLLHPGPGQTAARLLREARSQARVNHDHVAKVVEVGASDGIPFIAMQLVDGPTLQRAADALSLEEKVEVVRQAAGAVHAAHLEGLVHRDIKPSNILLERTLEGTLKAYVVDFGLVRDLERAGDHSLTVTAGTPHYMAPEQIRGEAARVDWRTDVYALGATLFELVAGRPPFAGGSAPAVMLRALEEQARFPRAGPRPPADLEAVVLHCLEKEPQHRYGSARELMEDLERFLRGEPVSARPVPAAVRLLRAARRRPRLTTAVLAAAAFTTCLVGLWLHAVLTTRRVAEVSRRFGEEAAAMESIGRLAALQPLHDVRREQEMIRARVARLAAQVEHLHGSARGPGRLALGRGWLALGDTVAARRELEAAWGLPYRPPEVAAALGEALARTYQEAVDDALRIPNRAQREARLRALETELKQPALEALAAARSTADGNSMVVEGQLALLAGRWDEALASARAARESDPWLYQTWQLQGDVHLAQAEEAADEGAVEEALRLLDLAAGAYAAGIDAARSDQRLRQAECRRRYRVMAVDDGVRVGLAQRADWVVAACNETLAANPDDVVAHATVAAAFGRLARKQQVDGYDPRPTLAHAAAAAERALAVEPGYLPARTTLGLSLVTRGDWEALHGLDPRPAFRQAVTHLEQVVALAPSQAPAHYDLANAYNCIADWENEHGGDPRPAVTAAYEHFERALRLVPDDPVGHHNLAVNYLRRASAPQRWGLDPEDRALEKAAEHFRAAIARRPDLYRAFNGLGSVQRSLANELNLAGQDPRPLLSEAIASFDSALALRPDWGWPLFNRSIALRQRARAHANRGGDPFPDLVAAEADLARARELMPADPDVSSSLAATLMLHAECLAAAGGDPGPLLARALEQADRTISLNPAEAFAWETRGDILFLRAEDAHRRQEDPEGDLALALAAAAEARRLDPESPDAWILEGRVWLARAFWFDHHRRERAERAVTAYLRAREVHPEGIAVFAEQLAAAERLAAGGEPGAETPHG